MKPTNTEVKELAKFFPSYGSSSKVPMKKKTGPTKRKQKPFSTSVIVLKTFKPFLPRGNARHQLARDSRIQSILMNHDMTDTEVRTKVASVFKCSPHVTLLESSSTGSLCKCADQEINGQRAGDKRGCLYFCEDFPAEDDFKDLTDSGVKVGQLKRKVGHN